MYIWQLDDWQGEDCPSFHWQSEPLQKRLDALVASALRSSEIEGEQLDVASLRSSVVRQLGPEQAGFLKLKKQEYKAYRCSGSIAS